MKDYKGVVLDELLDKDVPEAQQFIHSAVDRLSLMIDTLLNLARVGRREMIYKKVDMSKLVNTVLQSYHHQTEENSLAIPLKHWKYTPRNISNSGGISLSWQTYQRRS